jgi:16S rRNA processing protein RimM
VDQDAHTSYIAIARVARTRGNRGEVLTDLYSDFPDRFDDLEDVCLKFSDGRLQPMVLEETWEHKGRRVMKFSGVDSISAAEAFVGCWVVIPEEQAVLLPEGTYFDHDLVGCIVQDVRGNQIGIVDEIRHIVGNPLLVVRKADQEFLIPAVDSICIKISVEEKQILIDPPEGLMDLGQ